MTDLRMRVVCLFVLTTLALKFIRPQLISSNQTIGKVFKNYYPMINFKIHLISQQEFSYEESLYLPASCFLCDIMN